MVTWIKDKIPLETTPTHQTAELDRLGEDLKAWSKLVKSFDVDGSGLMELPEFLLLGKEIDVMMGVEGKNERRRRRRGRGNTKKTGGGTTTREHDDQPEAERRLRSHHHHLSLNSTAFFSFATNQKHVFTSVEP